MRGRRLLSVLLAVFVLLIPAAGTGVAVPLPTDWTVTPGGLFYGTGGESDGPFHCESSLISGEFAPSGTFLGTIDDVQYNDCFFSIVSQADVYSLHPWTVRGVAQNVDYTTISVEDIGVGIIGSYCYLTVSGSVTFAYTSYDRPFLGVIEHHTEVTYVDPVYDCYGLVAVGDAVPVVSTLYGISPDQLFTIV